MRRGSILTAALLAACATVVAQTPERVTFDVVSIKRHVAGGPDSNVVDRPDGALTMTNVPVVVLLSRAFAPIVPAQMTGLPDWAGSEGYDVRTTSPLSNPSVEQRRAMIRAMLADRFGLVAHIVPQEQSVYDLVMARSDGRLGAGLTRIDTDCDRVVAEREANPSSSQARPDFAAPPPPCTFRAVGASLRDRSGDKQGRLGDLLEGEGTMFSLARILRAATVLPVVDKTGLSGSYRVTMNFDMAFARRPPAADPLPNAAPSVFTAIQEQLGLKLQSSKEHVDTLVIEHLDRPTPD